MCSSFLQLTPGSRNLSQAEKRITVTIVLCEANQNPQDYTYNCPELSCHNQGKLGNPGAN